MEINSLQNMWDAFDEESSPKLNIKKELISLVASNKIKAMLLEVKLEAYIEIAVHLIVLYFLNPFIIDHIDQPVFWVSGALLYLASLYSVIMHIYILVLFYSLKMDTPIVKMQMALAKMQYFEKLDIHLLLVFFPLLAAPVVLVLTKGLFGADFSLYPEILINFSIGSFIVGLIMVAILKIFPNKTWKEAKAYLREVKTYE